ncbi:MAG: caspase family protein [Myxococcota bacterium]
MMCFPVLVGLLLGSPDPAGALESKSAVFALIIGVNNSQDFDLPPLEFADDDASRYFDLFRALGARTFVLAGLDANTARLHPQAVAEAVLPNRANLHRAVKYVSEEIARAKRHGIRTVLYVIYAGHGRTENGEGFVTLVDGWLGGRELRRDIIAAADADLTHVIVDACNSYYLARGRGPGGQRRGINDFSDFGEGWAANVGFILSTSSAEESHEWTAIQSGIFSHEVRSGLYGAADADRNGRVTYGELSGFIERANKTVPNARYRPRVFVQAPAQGHTLLDLRDAMNNRLEIQGSAGDHYLFENNQGVRIAEFHNSREQDVRLVRSRASGPLFLRRVGGSREYFIPDQPGALNIADLKTKRSRSRGRGAAHESFKRLFEVAFDSSYVPVKITSASPQPMVKFAAGEWSRRPWAWVSAGVSAALALGGGTAIALARREQTFPDNTPQADVRRFNQRTQRLNRVSVGLFAASILAGASATWLFLPVAAEESTAVEHSMGALLMYTGRF